MLRRISWLELQAQKLYDVIEPMDDPWITSAMICSLVASFGGDKVKLGDIYSHLKPPPEDPKLLEIRARQMVGSNNRRFAGRQRK